MLLKRLELSGFKSFAKKTTLTFDAPVSAIVGPNGSGKSNLAEAFRFVLGEQSLKSLRGKRGEDLIWNGSAALPRMSRAQVRVVFQNVPKFFNVDFDEVAIERAVHRDGVNDYSLNGSRTRLKDVMELLFSANIGATGHHIISQGETDRVLLASPRERREMLEDALGLKVYQYKKEESGKRLEKTRENIAHVAALRKELAPHLAFLKKQAEKVEKAAALRGELAEHYRGYFARESRYLALRAAELERERRVPEAELEVVKRELARAKEAVARAADGGARGAEALGLEQELSKLRKEKERLGRELGRLEGQLAAEAARTREAAGAVIPAAAAERVVAELEREAAAAPADAAALRGLLGRILARLKDFVREYAARGGGLSAPETAALAAKKVALDEALARAAAREEDHAKALRLLQREAEAAQGESRQAERELFRLMGREQELRVSLESQKASSAALAREEEDFKRELGEAGALVGRAALDYERAEIPREAAETRGAQDERRRKIERMKIRLEEFGGASGDDLMAEYREASERDAFLAREVADLEASAASLETLILELSEKLDAQFREGIEKINAEFARLFILTFGSGAASLRALSAPPRRRRGDLNAESDLEDESPSGPLIEDEAEEGEEGIDIEVSLPHKRVRGLQMLSGGERALTSIALLFAMSSVHPPPFIILDETDAALDEANSRRYGDMVEDLAKKSQLILITHNRETMSRASILYGVTMGGDGVSKLLSVKFEEAIAVAK